jgi:hypothetical protein
MGVAGGTLGHNFALLGKFITAAMGDCVSGEVMQSITAFAGMTGGGFDLGSVASRVLAGTITTAIMMIAGVAKN